MATSEIVTKLGIVSTISNAVGASEPAIRLLLTILSGYLISVLFHYFIVNRKSKAIQHFFFATSGILLCYFNYGVDTYHSCLCILATYIFLHVLHKFPNFLVCVNFAFHMCYLLTGYYFTESNEYDILWTMPHCVLVLRMIGLGFDVADGCKRRETLSKDQFQTALEKPPTLLELAAFSYFPCSFIVGPQFPFRRYKRFIDGEFRQYEGSVKNGIERMLLGCMYLGICQLGAFFLPNDYFLTEDFENNLFWRRLLYLGIWGRFSLYKYISCWLLAEGSIMCIGLSYNGKTANGKDDWSGCSNVKLKVFEMGTTMQHYVQSFNVNTNNWVAQYVYKRLKFLNNRMLSYAGALCFLAVWHGFHSGYYIAFFLEFLVVTAEKQIESIYKEIIIPKYGNIVEKSFIHKLLVCTILKIYNIIYMGWSLIPFIFLSYSRWIRVFSAVNYIGFYYLATWFSIHLIYKYKFASLIRERGGHTQRNAPLNQNIKVD